MHTFTQSPAFAYRANSTPGLKLKAVCLFAMLAVSGSAYAFSVNDLDGDNGYILRGAMPDAKAGFSVGTGGDVNADGIDDLVVGSDSGMPYIVYGKAGSAAAVLSLKDIDGSNGFALTNRSEFNDEFGYSVSIAGDLNNDGISDIVVGAPRSGDGNRGRVFVVYGSAQFSGAGFDVSELDGSNGFTLELFSGYQDIDHRIGHAVASGGDVDGDGVDDLLITAPNSDNFNDSNFYSYGNVGRTYVYFGEPGNTAATVGLESFGSGDADIKGYDIYGQRENYQLGESVAMVGDTNGDGRDDFVVTAGGGDGSSAALLFFGEPRGRTRYSEYINASRVNVFLLWEGETAVTVAGAAGDINNDGLADLVLSSKDGIDGEGEIWVVLGVQGQGDLDWITPERLSNRDYFVVDFPGAKKSAGRVVSGGSDINGDGIDDLVIAQAFKSDKDKWKGMAHVVFGKTGTFASPFDATLLDGVSGMSVSGLSNSKDKPSFSLGATGDLNNDAVNDLVVATPSTPRDIGKVFVVNGGSQLGTMHSMPTPSMFLQSSCNGLVCQFSAGNRNATDMYVTNYEWRFGDGVVNDTQNPSTSKLYAQPGYYDVTLTVTDKAARTTQTLKSIVVSQRDGELQKPAYSDTLAANGRVILPSAEGVWVNGWQNDRKRRLRVAVSANADTNYTLRVQRKDPAQGTWKTVASKRSVSGKAVLLVQQRPGFYRYNVKASGAGGEVGLKTRHP